MDNEFCDPEQVRNAITGIVKGFHWSETEEGAAFWGNVVDILQDRLDAQHSIWAGPPLEELLLGYQRKKFREMTADELDAGVDLFPKPPAKQPSAKAPVKHWYANLLAWLKSWIT